ncbi:MAG: hypothetical protein AN487_17575 [Anabaena sp. CRKS33]|nr:MAG: hypothetical protein AN487_17575 [Anabaena sp. CRKS33]
MMNYIVSDWADMISCYAPELYNLKMVKSCGVGILPADMISCYAPELYNLKMVKSCGVGILPARLIQIKYTTAYNLSLKLSKTVIKIVRKLSIIS